MRIGIVTFQRAENYGAALQCRALYQYLENLGHDVEVIDYKNEALEKAYRLFPKLRKNLIKYAASGMQVLLHLNALKGRKEKYKDFFGQLAMTERLTADNLRQSGLDHDLIIAGSDQIWNTKITKGFDEVYFLQFPGDFIRASYAVSAGTAEFLRAPNAQFDGYMQTFDYLAVREKQLAEYVERSLKRSIPQTLDPTLLLDAKQWAAMVSGVHVKVPEKYILMYNVKPAADLGDIAAKLSREEHMPIVYIDGSAHPFGHIDFRRQACGVKEVIDVGPAEFVYLIKNAHKVVTSSFHGTVFSCIFQKDVTIYIPERSGDARLEELAGMFGIQDRVFYSYKEYCERASAARKITYDTKIYDKLRAESVRYLDEITHPHARDTGKDPI